MIERSQSLKASRCLIESRSPLSKLRCNLSGRIVPEVCRNFKRLDPKLKPVTWVLIGTGQVAGSQS
jgi:hypothetical protein